MAVTTVVPSPAQQQATPSRLRIAVGHKTGTGPLTMLVTRHQAAAAQVAEFAGLADDDLLDVQLAALSAARTTITQVRADLASAGYLHLVDRTVAVPVISREALRLRTLMRSADYSPDEPHEVAALETVAGITPGLLADVLAGRALVDRLPQQSLVRVLGYQASA